MDDAINGAQVGGFIRWATGALLAYFVGKGWIPVGVAGDVVAVAGIVGMGIWSYFVHKSQNIVASAAELPQVKKIVTTQQMAMAVPSQKVVANA